LFRFGPVTFILNGIDETMHAVTLNPASGSPFPQVTLAGPNSLSHMDAIAEQKEKGSTRKKSYTIALEWNYNVNNYVCAMKNWEKTLADAGITMKGEFDATAFAALKIGKEKATEVRTKAAKR
jgi:hypothetical protein